MKKIIIILILVLSIVVPFTVSYAQNFDDGSQYEQNDDATWLNQDASFDDGSQYEQNDPVTPEPATQDNFYQDANDDSVDTDIGQQKTTVPTTRTTTGKTLTNTTVSGSQSNVSAKLQNPLKVDSIESVILLAVDIMIYVGVSFAILAIIFVGFKFVMAQGKPEEINKAKAWFLWIIIGLAVLISAKVIVEIVQNTLVKSGVVNQGFLKP